MPPKVRNKENRPLPKRWTWKGGSLYYIVPDREKIHWDNKSWFRLGKSLAEAHKTFSTRMHETKNTQLVTMADLFDAFQFEYMPTLSRQTQNYYLYALPRLREMFAVDPFPVQALEPHHAYTMSEHLVKTESAKIAKQCSECLSSALSLAVRRGTIKANPLIQQYKKPTTPGRKRRISDEELLAFLKRIPRKWQLYTLLKLYTRGRRQGELLRIQRSHLLEQGILFVNNKRPEDTFLIQWTPELHAVVTEILNLMPDPNLDQFLYFNRKGEPYMDEEGKASGFQSIWGRYVTQALEDGIIKTRFTEHDLRAKAVEHEDEGVAQRLLRHTNIAVTRKHYRRAPEVL